MTRSIALALAALALSVHAIAIADPQSGKGKGKGKAAEVGAREPAPGTISAGISVADARRIAIEVGVIGYKPLPPGIRKKLARGKPLPPGIAKRYAPAPMLTRLPAQPGYEWRVVGTDLVLIAIATAVVVDILFDVFD